MTIVRCLLALGALHLGACTSGDLHEECKVHDDCPLGQVCSFEVCVDEGSVQGQVCREGRAYCDGTCVDVVATLDTCGGCDGCAAVGHAQALACNQGSCIYVCEDGWRDTDNNTANGCECAPDVDCACRPTGDEVCDGLDNDCDGGVDNVGEPVDGALWVRSCGTRPFATPANCGVGGCVFACDPGHHDRNADMNDGCECEASPEVCDGEDNDCNGIIDDGDPGVLCPAPAGADGACAGRTCIFQCQEGLVDIDGDLRRGPEGTGCECAPVGQEICDGLDNDCDGLTDAEDDDLQTALCEEQRGVCEGARRSCVGGRETICADNEYRLNAQSNGDRWARIDAYCDGADNDCDGLNDEHCCRYDDGLPAWEATDDGTGWTLDAAAHPRRPELVVVVGTELGTWVSSVDVVGLTSAPRIRLDESGLRVAAVAREDDTVALTAGGNILRARAVDGDDVSEAVVHVVPQDVDRDYRRIPTAAFSDGSVVFGLGGGAGFTVGILSGSLDDAQFREVDAGPSRVVDVVAADEDAIALVETADDEQTVHRVLYRLRRRRQGGFEPTPVVLDLGYSAEPIDSFPLSGGGTRPGTTSALVAWNGQVVAYASNQLGYAWGYVLLDLNLNVLQSRDDAGNVVRLTSMDAALPFQAGHFVWAGQLRSDRRENGDLSGFPHGGAIRILGLSDWLAVIGLGCDRERGCDYLQPRIFGSSGTEPLCLAE